MDKLKEAMMKAEIDDDLTSSERGQIAEIHKALASQNLSVAEKKLLEEELLAKEKIRAEHLDKLLAHEFLREEMIQAEQRLADPRMPAEDRKKLKQHADELRTKIDVSNGTRKLTRIRGERISDSALNRLMSRLGVRVGDTITGADMHRLVEAARAIDEHLEVDFHPDGEGGIELVVIAP